MLARPVLLALLLVLSYVAVTLSAIDFSNPPTVMALVGHSRGEALFSDVNVAYASETDETTTSYQSASAVSGLLTDYMLELNDAVITLSRLDPAASEGWSQLPIAAYGLVVTVPTSSSIVLDRPTLGAIWSGAVSTWEDPAIAALNGGSSPLAGNITLVVTNHTTASDEHADPTGVFARALALFDPDGFGAAYAAHGRRLAATLLATIGPERLVIVQPDVLGDDSRVAATLSGSLLATTYALRETASRFSVPFARLKNKAGAVLNGPSTAALTAALDEFDPTTPEASLDTDILDGAAAGSWPLAGLMFAILRTDVSRSDCDSSKEVLTLFSWMQLNDMAISTISDNGLVPLTLGFRRRTIDAMCTVHCNGVPTIPASVVIGSGTPLPLWASLAKAYDPQGGFFRLKYYQRNQNIAMPLVSDYKIDFGTIVLTEIPQTYLDKHPDLILIPMFLMGHAVAYNIPELLREPEPLVLSLEVLARIYLNDINMWNDPSIKALNPDLADVLPEQPILVVLNKGGPVNEAGGPAGGNPNRGLAQMLSAVPGFAEAVISNNGNNITYPIESTDRVLLGGRADVPTFLANTSYTLGEYGYSSTSFYRAIRYATLINVDGGRVRPSEDTLESAANTVSEIPSNAFVINSPGNNSWPVGLWNLFMIHSSTLPNCRKTTALLDWFYWAQTSEEAVRIIGSLNCLVSSKVEWLAPRILASLTNITCPDTGQSAFSLAPCVTFLEGSTDEAVMCSGHGTCSKPSGLDAVGSCTCDPGWEGERCETPVSSSDFTAAAIAIGVSLGGAALLLLLLGILCLFLVPYYWVILRQRQRDADWEIKLDELELDTLLGRGGFGEVYKSVWRGTEVAVKTLAPESMTKEATAAFRAEVKTMTSLRHPNIVLFMAACTKPPHLAIVMEYMALGSLFDLLSNELVSVLPFSLKVKIAYQAAKGMHFLHSSNVVHRDLKSLNVLLDPKWNAKISDFGLTHFASKPNRPGIIGTVHWTAPEVLDDKFGHDPMTADVYSFGIVMWEILTREQPYAGMTPAAIAVGVIRDDLRPPLSREDDPAKYLVHDSMLLAGAASEYIELTMACWDRDPQMRPAFLEIMTRLCHIIDMTREASDVSFHNSNSSSSQSSRHAGLHVTGTSSSSGGEEDHPGMWRGATRPPDGHVALVFTDIADAHALWSAEPEAMRDSTIMHNELLRALAERHGGHEAMLPRGSGEGTFCMAFSDPVRAARWCAQVQRDLLDLEWPAALLEHDAASEEFGHDAKDRIIFRGLRVRMGLHVGHERAAFDHKTRRAEYRGNTAREALRLVSSAQPGQILLSAAAADAVREIEDSIAQIAPCGTASSDDGKGVTLFELKPNGLEGRLFVAHSMSEGSSGYHNSTSGNLSDDRFAPDGRRHAEVNKHYVASANMVRWVIDFSEVEMANQDPIGAGSYGVVYRGRWSGIDVAVKRFIKQRVTERRLLEFRAEVALLSELQHPNIVLFVGACVHPPNLAIITEFMPNGSLAAVLADSSRHRLSFAQRMRMLKSAAQGVHYLHTLEPVIVHRDLKSSNLLVDENYNVKVADFGLARIREDNATMTKCGTPSWTAPEIIRGERYSEKADVYSFGIVMWEVLTRRKPHEGLNFMNVSLEVLKGMRPPLPSDCPPALAELIEACWHDNPKKRPDIINVIRDLSALIGDDGDVPA